jgi:hypothetical protein
VYFYTPKLKITHCPQCVQNESMGKGYRKPEWGGMAQSIPPNLELGTLNLKKKTKKKVKD